MLIFTWKIWTHPCLLPSIHSAHKLVHGKKWRELVSSGCLVCKCHDVFLWLLRLFCFASFSSLCFRWSCGPSFNRLSICTRPDSHTWFIFSFRLFGDVVFSEYLVYHFFCTIAACSLYGEYVVRSFLPNGVFLPCDHGLDFWHSLDENSINQSTKLKKKAAPVTRTTLRTTVLALCRRTLGSERHRYAIIVPWPDHHGTDPMAVDGIYISVWGRRRGKREESRD